MPKKNNAEQESSKFAVVWEIHEFFVKPIIQEFRQDLVNAKIMTMTRSGNWKSQGQVVWGNATKVNEQMKSILGEASSEVDFVITVNEEVWYQLSREERMALVDHELAHCFVDEDEDGNPKYTLIGHDIEEFWSIIRRHGPWREAIEKTLHAAAQNRQQTLFDTRDKIIDMMNQKDTQDFVEAFSQAEGV
jgi:hypothetical protein